MGNVLSQQHLYYEENEIENIHTFSAKCFCIRYFLHSSVYAIIFSMCMYILLLLSPLTSILEQKTRIFNSMVGIQHYCDLHEKIYITDSFLY